MHITQHSDYAMRVLLYAGCNEGHLVSIANIAKNYNISKSHLMKVVPTLVKGGFITSVRGNKGGLKLAKPAHQINIGEVFRHTEPLILAECFSENNQCHITPACRLISVLDGAKTAFLHHLDGYTLADLLSNSLSNILTEELHLENAHK